MMVISGMVVCSPINDESKVVTVIRKNYMHMSSLM